MGVHNKTPTLSANDPRGLAIRTVDYWRGDGVGPAQSRIHRTLHDAAGRAVAQWDPRLWALQMSDPLTPANLTTVYSLNSQVLRSDSVDAGTQVALYGLGAQVLLGWDSLGTRREAEYDVLLRLLAVFEEGIATPRRCVERYGYGQPGAGEPSKNQLGQLIRHDDPAGSVLFETFAITGQCSENIRYFTQDPVTPDWPERIEDRARLLEPGEGATSRWRFGPLAQVLEQVDARGNRQGVELTVDGRLRAAHVQLKLQPDTRPMVSDIRYNADGQVEHELAGNGVRASLTYQPQNGRLVSRRTTDSSARLLQHLLYTYDPMGNVLSIEDAAQPIRYFANQRIDPISRFTYDSLYQLSEASGWEAGANNQGPTPVSRADPAAFSNYRQTYRYDAGGNLLELTHVGAQAHGRQFKTARYSNRGLSWRNGVAPTEAQIAAAYDARGNLLELDQGRFVQWDLRNQLHLVSPVERVSESDDQEIYLYDAGGQRVRKIRSLQTHTRTVINEVRYLPGLELRVDSAGEILQVISAQTAINSINVLHWEGPPPAGSNDRYRYNVVDHLGSASLESGEDGRIISQESYYPFGETAWSRESEVSYRTLRYSGKERDATGLYYYGLRYYVPWLQRWMNPDPEGFIDGGNLYRMVLNNPMTYLDSDGAITRKPLANGLWEPVIASGSKREMTAVAFTDKGEPNRFVPAMGNPTPIAKALQTPEFGKVVVDTKFLDPTPGRYSKAVVSGLSNTAGGAEFIFTMDKLTYSGASNGAFNALRIVDIAAGQMPDKANAVSGYWAPQGGYVDIPVNPSGVQPDHVFTPAFSGCSLTVEQLNRNVLRVRHVEGGKEDTQFNNLPRSEHGLGLGATMEYPDYGYAANDSGQLQEFKNAFAFMKFDRKQQTWNIHYQTIEGTASITRYEPAKRGLFTKTNASVSAHASIKVRQSMSKRVAIAR
ncbi:RHS repeat domain-containing protein [Pseudomonas parakoreensis]|uniref:RHS repeat domain-containing protein n=1 Tax=Pseudomonas parakoreensis TaxID=2892331 RepID=UPI003FD58C06